MSDDVKGLIDTLGAMAEMSITLYRSALQAGATTAEAIVILDSFMRAFMGRGKQKEEGGDD
ncbi:hypothetical protein B5G43_03055 [Flavonifractor sp. An92]|uniref:hypothetical protein n=1 Tax=Flavonifractor sp. An92 TaxID=1965666 RepID=UPI000B36B3CE|nr:MULTISPECIES: hypothetical protein [unclassified Flavonifractor]OUN08372.1 hypothetical protein B5G43_03055 [Flavonifractor sp. An92]OUQ22160.1 hypothetical protein B5E80_15285 [Flavonifractor sp. An135]